MRNIKICDMTMRQDVRGQSLSLTFKEKIELAKQLDKLGVSVIELEGMTNGKEDSLRIKSIASSVKKSTLAIPVGLSEDGVDMVWDTVNQFDNIRLQIVVPVSTAQMEYLYHIKSNKLLEILPNIVKSCVSKTSDTEVIIQDCTRGDDEFVEEVIKIAIDNGISTVTIDDSAGESMPKEFSDYIGKLINKIPDLNRISLGISCSNNLFMADVCATEAVLVGANEIKAAAYPINTASLANIIKIIDTKSEELDASVDVRTVELNRIINQISWLCENKKGNNTFCSVNSYDDENDVYLTKFDSKEDVLGAIKDLGYDLSEEDEENVWSAFSDMASSKEKITLKELDIIVASSSMQVTPTYKIESYSISLSNNTAAMAHIKLNKKDEDKSIEGVAIGDGPIDAAFLALEHAIGIKYELDDFQIRSITQGRESLGETLVKLLSEGKIYSGRGVSTDIVESGIRAYINAINKIVCEEEI